MTDKLFYIIYNSYYKHGKFHNDIPPLTVFGIFCVAANSIIMTLVSIAYLYGDPLYLRNNHLPNKGLYFLTSIVFTYFTFYHNKRYQKIYKKHSKNKAYDELYSKVIAFSIMVLFIITPFIFILFYNKLYFGSW